MEILKTLGIDWSLLFAQAVNFGVILFILARFVYRPVLDLIEKRRAMIQKSVEDAKYAQSLREEMEEARAAVLRKADQEAGTIMENARKEAEAMRGQIAEAAQRQSEQILGKGRKELEEERMRALSEVQQKMAHVVMRATEKILDREFSDSDQKRIMADIEKSLPSLLS